MSAHPSPHPSSKATVLYCYLEWISTSITREEKIKNEIIAQNYWIEDKDQTFKFPKSNTVKTILQDTNRPNKAQEAGLLLCSMKIIIDGTQTEDSEKGKVLGLTIGRTGIGTHIEETVI